MASVTQCRHVEGIKRGFTRVAAEVDSFVAAASYPASYHLPPPPPPPPPAQRSILYFTLLSLSFSFILKMAEIKIHLKCKE